MAIAVEYAAISYFIFTNEALLRLDQPISYFSMISTTKEVFTLAFVVAAILVAIFGYWLYQTYPLNKKFISAYGAIVVSQIIFASFTDGGSQQIVHLLAALLTGAAMPLSVYLFIKQAKPQRYKNVMAICLCLQVIAFATLLLSSGRFILLNEVILGAAFHLWAVLATFDLPSRA
jgi:hypothetical protein